MDIICQFNEFTQQKDIYSYMERVTVTQYNEKPGWTVELSVEIGGKTFEGKGSANTKKDAKRLACSRLFVAYRAPSVPSLMLIGGIEPNPGPVMSKYLAVTSRNDFRMTVNTQGFRDLISFTSNVPTYLTTFSKDFSTFVEKLPDRLFIEETASGVKQSCSQLVDLVQNTFNRMETQLISTCDNLNVSLDSSRKVIFGVIIILIIWFSLSKLGLTGTIATIFLGFAINYFNVFSNIKDCVLTNGQKFWDWIGFNKVSNVNVEGFSMDVAANLMQDSRAPVLFSAIFTSIFVLAVKNSPGTKDLEDLSRKIFSYQRGANSVAAIFDKATDLWEYMVDIITHKLGIQASEGNITNWSVMNKINNWVKANETLFHEGFGEVPNSKGEEITFDERKRRRARLMEQYNTGIDYINLGRYVDRSVMLIIQQWNQRILKKVEQMSTEAINGEMRNPPTVMLLYGRSGVGKTSMCDGIKALASAVIADTTGKERTSPANVYVRNSDMDHWDGYHGQQFVMFDDLGCRKDNEANPNKELAELICAKNSQPYPLPMAHLEDKGKFFTSQFIFCTTNISNMASYVKSMTYPEAIVSRLSEMPFIVRIKPQYRKIMTAEEIKTLSEKQIHDQHYVDKYRAQYEIDDNLMKEKFPNLDWSLPNINKTLTVEQFEKIRPKNIKRCEDGTAQIVNYHIYYFEPMDIRTGKACGAPIEWTELCNIVENIIRKRLERGENLLKQQRAFHLSSLEDIKQGKITTPKVVKTQGGDDDFEDAVNDEDKHIFKVNRFHDIKYVTDNKLFNPSIRQRSLTPIVEELIEFWGFGFEADLIDACINRDLEENVFPVPPTRIGDPIITVLKKRWQEIWTKRTEYYAKIQTTVQSEPVMKMLKLGGIFVGWITFMVVIVKGTEMLTDKILPKEITQAKKIVDQEIHERTKHLPWWSKLFGNLGTVLNPVHISRGTLNLTPEQIFAIYEIYNLAVVNVEGGGEAETYAKGDNVRLSRRLKMRVATAGFNIENLKENLVEDFKHVKVQSNEDELVIDFDERLIHHVLVTVQSHQLTNEAIAHVLPANIYMMDYMDVNNVARSIGNVTFLNDRAILFPYHYIQRMEHDFNRKKILNDDCVFTFSRAPTHLELGRNAPANKMRCTYLNIKNYARINAPVFIDDVAHLDKDAVIVYLSGSGVSGHNCANIIKKFVRREDLSKICSSGLNGYMVVQRNVGYKLNQCTPLKMSVTLGCTSISPVNVMRRTGNNWCDDHIMDFQGEQTLLAENGEKCTYYITLRDRYEYTAGTQPGDCGSILWIDHPQLSHCVVGMHSTDHPTSGKGCSVPITQEDIEETLKKLGRCAVNAFTEPDLTPLDEQDIFGPNALVPQGNFQYIGKKTEAFPMQPLKTSIIASPIQQNLYLLKNEYSRKTNKHFSIDILKAPAVMRVAYQNPENCKLFEKRNQIFFQMKDEQPRICSKSDYEVWLAKGGIKRDPLIEGLAKNSLAMPLIRSKLIDNAVNHVAQKLLKNYNPLCVDSFSKAMAQNNFYISDQMKQINKEIKDRNYLISSFIIEQWKGNKIKKFSMTETFEKILRNISLNKKEIKIFNEAVKKNYSGAQGLDDLLVDLASHSRYEEIENLNSEFANPMILTIEQSVSGIDGDGTIRSINGKKSPGHPYDQQKKPYGKKWWTGKEMKCDGPGWPLLKKDVEQLIEEAKTKIPIVYFVDTMKDELRTHEKIKNFKTRIFSAGPMHFSIAFRMYFLRFLSFVMENKIDNESAIGINPYGTDWEKLAQHLSVWGGPTCIAGDYSNFDGSLNNQIMEKLLDIVEAFYAQYGSTEEERNIRKNLWSCLTRSLHIARDGGVYRWYNSQPSGNPYTTLINVMFNMVVFRMVYSLIFGGANAEELKNIFPNGYGFLGIPPKKTLASFDDNVRFVAYGDDNCANINPEIIDWFNMHTISRAMSLFGLTYTDEHKNKDGEVEKARFITDINFLKRGFKKIDQNGRKWIAPLDIDTVKEILMWVRTSDSVRRDQIMADNVKVTCMEMVLHGEKMYDDWLVFIEGLRNKNLLGDKFPAIDNYDDQFDLTCNETYES